MKSTLLTLVLLVSGCGVDASGTSGSGVDAGDAGRLRADAGAKCDSDNDCTGMGLLCNLNLSRCQECILDADCGDAAVCAGGSCEPFTACTNSLGCIDAPGDLAICDRDLGRCVRCVIGADCGDGQDCQDNACVDVERCTETPDCGDGKVCDADTSLCVECERAADCAGGALCSGDGTCQPACDSDADCTPSGQLCDRAVGHCVVPSTGERATGRDVNFEKLDLLFVVDDSKSMREEQQALGVQFPRLIEILTTGDRDLDGSPDFPAMTDVHLAVVSTDLGVGPVTGIAGCGPVGKDGVMNTVPGAGIAGCEPSYPKFLSYRAETDSVAGTARDFACLAALGIEGCAFEQQLEAGLKALWPSTGKGITFLGASQGQGDGPNAGFLRNDPGEGLSLISVIVVTDEEDCSTPDTRIFTPPMNLQPGDPLEAQPMNLRCFMSKDRLYGVERYVDGLRSLRAGIEELVTFGAIVGVPPDLVSDARRAAVDFSDAAARNAYYDTILRDPRMAETVDPATTGNWAQAGLTASCITATGRAYPPRRIVEVAQGFGENGVVASICEDDFTGAIDAIIGAIVRRR